MKYLSVSACAEKWGINESAVRRYCILDRIPGAVMKNNSWRIPENAKRPTRIDPTPAPDKKELPPLARKLVSQKNGRNYHGLYDYVQLNLTYSSCRMASCRLTRDQIDTIIRKGKVAVSFEPMKVSDVIETLNHSYCVDYILEHVMDPLTPAFILRLHYLLMSGTIDARDERVAPGEYRRPDSPPCKRKLNPASQIGTDLTALLKEYEKKDFAKLADILEFHVRFETIFPFEDANGRIGRLLMFKECLRREVMPFILDDKRRGRYIEGIKKWEKNQNPLTVVVQEAQQSFESQIELQILLARSKQFQPAGYCEGEIFVEDDEDDDE